ncbi:phosphoglycerate mutase [Macrolepiota fuliginosa MF-IS2]|uniref:Phosphoglycerate mutase n=1 Tax=Macrolepiota fuliginosa MF-IS2 TaxID=1400762 RepID=A0A9P5XD14_9AGAR|nr:phosphoglycerate mutase [Macrolepiota fuliginosa MF-IS2]
MTVSPMNEPVPHRKYESILGFFAQDDQAQDDPIPPRLGLIDDSPQRWSNLKQKLRELNEGAKPGESFKLFFFWRHGQSYHNVGKDKYGLQQWRKYWGRINGDDEITWGPDSDLTPAGVIQALLIKHEWEKEQAFGIPVPDKIYTSPLTRALRTCDIAFDWLAKDEVKGPVFVVENCREENGIYTYDKRHSRTHIAKTFPRFHIEGGFSEEDELWLPDTRETKEAMAARARAVLDMIFNEAPAATYVCCTVHGGLINAFLSVLGRPKRSLPTGG